MFRITKAFENEGTCIYRIEGKVTDEMMDCWIEEMDHLKNFTKGHVILDLSQLWFLSSKAADVLIDVLQENLFLLNCPLAVRNVLHASGLSSKTLD